MTSRDRRPPSPPSAWAAAPRPSRPARPGDHPPNVGETGDPFTALRVIDLARPPRARPARSGSLTSPIGSTRRTSTGCFPCRSSPTSLLQLQANWMADYRNSSGIVIEDGPSGPTAHDRGLEPGRSVDRPPGPPRRRLVYRAACRVQPPRPTVVRRLTGGPRSPRRRTAHDTTSNASRTKGSLRHEPQRIRHDDALVDADWAQGPPRRSRTSDSSRSTSIPPPTSRATSRVPSAGTGPASSPTASAATSPRARTSRSSCPTRASAPTRRSSCTATTTTGSPPGPTGSSSCTATRTSGSSTAGASTGSTTACRSRPTCRRTPPPGTSCPSPTSACARIATTSCRASATPARARRCAEPGRVQRRDHRPARA